MLNSHEQLIASFSNAGVSAAQASGQALGSCLNTIVELRQQVAEMTSAYEEKCKELEELRKSCLGSVSQDAPTDLKTP